MKRIVYFLAAAAAVGCAKGSVLRGAGNSAADSEKPVDQLSDEELGIKIGDLTPTKLKFYKNRIHELKGSLDTLMARQTKLNIEYETLLKTEGKDRDLKRQVRAMVARSVLKGMAALTDDRSAHVKSIVDEAVEQLKRDHKIALPHPDKPEETDSIDSATGVDSRNRNEGSEKLEKPTDDSATGSDGGNANGRGEETGSSSAGQASTRRASS